MKNDGLGPSQGQAITNRRKNDNLGVLGQSEALIGFGSVIISATGTIPEATSKIATGGGIVLAKVGVVTSYLTYETAPNKIINRASASTTKNYLAKDYSITPRSIK